MENRFHGCTIFRCRCVSCVGVAVCMFSVRRSSGIYLGALFWICLRPNCHSMDFVFPVRGRIFPSPSSRPVEFFTRAEKAKFVFQLSSIRWWVGSFFSIFFFWVDCRRESTQNNRRNLLRIYYVMIYGVLWAMKYTKTAAVMLSGPASGADN